MKELITNGCNREVNDNYIGNSARTHSNDPHHKNVFRLHVLLQIHHWLYSEIMIPQNKTALTKIDSEIYSIYRIGVIRKSGK